MINWSSLERKSSRIAPIPTLAINIIIHMEINRNRAITGCCTPHPYCWIIPEHIWVKEFSSAKTANIFMVR